MAKRFELIHPSPGWEGEIFNHRFVDGRSTTDSATLAHAMLEHGVRVIEAATGEPAFGSGEPDAQARLAAIAAARYPQEGR